MPFMSNKVLFGFHAVTVRLKTAPESIIEVHYDGERRDARMRGFLERCEEAGAKAIDSDDSRLSKLAPALLAMNTSAIYLGQALGAAGGGLVMTANMAAGRETFMGLSVLALAWTLVALWLSHRVRQEGLRAKG